MKRAALVVMAVAAGIALAGPPKKKPAAKRGGGGAAAASAKGDGGTSRIEFGTIEFNVKGTVTVFLDGRELGQTPLKPVKVLSGKHQLRLVNQSLGIDHTEELEVRPRQRSTLEISFEEQ